VTYQNKLTGGASIYNNSFIFSYAVFDEKWGKLSEKAMEKSVEWYIMGWSGRKW
jgi:hypothetical protein